MNKGTLGDKKRVERCSPHRSRAEFDRQERAIERHTRQLSMKEIQVALSDSKEKMPEPKFVCSIVSTLRPFTASAAAELTEHIQLTCRCNQFEAVLNNVSGQIDVWNTAGSDPRDLEPLAEAIASGFSLGWRRALR